jgi:hypothetical protein
MQLTMWECGECLQPYQERGRRTHAIAVHKRPIHSILWTCLESCEIKVCPHCTLAFSSVKDADFHIKNSCPVKKQANRERRLKIRSQGKVIRDEAYEMSPHAFCVDWSIPDHPVIRPWMKPDQGLWDQVTLLEARQQVSDFAVKQLHTWHTVVMTANAVTEDQILNGYDY